MRHLEFEDISVIADGVEASAESSAHLERCDECRERLRKVRELLVVAQTLPRDIAPPPEVWTALRERVARKPRPVSSPRRWMSPKWVAAAAAVVLLAGSVVMLPPNRGKSMKVIAPTSPAVMSVEKNYTPALSQLRETLDAQRTSLSPSTVSVVERSLATIDTAIAEARVALASDPGNQALVEILSSNYERKVDLLQRATELAPSF